MLCLVVAAALWASADVSLAPESYQTVKSGTCASAGGESISDLSACTAAGAELSTNSRAWNCSSINGGRVTNIHERDYPSAYTNVDYPSGCVVTSSGSLYFNTNDDTGKNCGTRLGADVTAGAYERSATIYCVCRFATVTPVLCQAATYAEDATGQLSAAAWAGSTNPYGSYDDVLILNVFVFANDAICQLWLDAGHNCSTKWEDVCATAHPEGAASNSKTVSTVGCSQCLTTPLSSEVSSYQIVQSGTCASAGGESISTGHLGWRVHDGGESISDLTACTAAGAELSIAWTSKEVVNSSNVPSGCIHRRGSLFFNQRASGRDCGYGSWHCVCRFTTAYSPSPPLPPLSPPPPPSASAQQPTAECTSAWTTFGGMGTQCGYSAESCASKQTACTSYAASITEAKMQEMATAFASCTGDLASLTMYNAEALTTSMLATFNRCGVTTALTPPALATCHGAFSKYTGMSSDCGYEGAYTCSASACIANAASASDSMVAGMVTGLATCTGDYASYGSYTAESLTHSFLSTFNACGLTSALTPLSLSTCIGAMAKMGEMSSCGDDGDDADNPRTAATCTSDACASFIASVTDTALQNMSTGLASCTGPYAYFQNYTDYISVAVREAASDCNLATALSTPVLCQADTYNSLALDAICQLWLDAGHNCSTKWEDVCENDYLIAATGGSDQNNNPLSMVSCGQCLEAGTSLVEAMVFEISMTASGTVETFDKAGFETNMRTYLGCKAPLCQVAIAVTAGSVNVVATVTDSTSTAVAAAAKLTTDSTAALSTALGVTVEAAPTVSAATETKLIVRTVAPSVAPSPPQSGSELRMGESAVVFSENGLSGGAIASIVVSCVVSAALMIGVAVLLKKTLQLPRPEEVTMPSLVKPEQV